MEYPIASPSAYPDKEWLLTEIEQILDGEKWLTMDEHCSAFEREFARHIGRESAIVANSCTSALETVFRALDVRGDEVIVPVQTFAANATSVLTTGGNLRFADINPTDYNISLESVQEQISDDTAAVVVVHFAGNVCERTAEIRALCEKHDAVLIEDCSHAHGAMIGDTMAGSIGHIACFSFYATKVLTSGEGGMILTDDPELAREAAAIRNRGLDPSTDDNRFEFVGSNYRLSEISAALGRCQLKHVDEFVEHRNTVARIYDDILSEPAEQGISHPVSPPTNVRSSYWRYLVKLEGDCDRTRIQELLSEDGIQIDWAYDPPLHRQPFVTKQYDTDGVAPNAESAMSRHICLPIHTDISVEDAKYIGERVTTAIRKSESAPLNE